MYFFAGGPGRVPYFSQRKQSDVEQAHSPKKHMQQTFKRHGAWQKKNDSTLPCEMIRYFAVGFKLATLRP